MTERGVQIESWGRPVTNVADHSGPDLGNGSPITVAATQSSARSSPGGGQGSCCTWCRRSNAGSSARNGRPQPGGARHSRWMRKW